MSEKEGHLGDERMQWMLDQMKGRNLWDELFELRDQQREELKKSVWLIKGNKLPIENNKQGVDEVVHASPAQRALHQHPEDLRPGDSGRQPQRPDAAPG
ncbi:MAG: hypothetical protein M5U08_17940 [Burkholderiales bacterium]|nr:hypothetical protein [Burkholderiales bacterium]